PGEKLLPPIRSHRTIFDCSCSKMFFGVNPKYSTSSAVFVSVFRPVRRGRRVCPREQGLDLNGISTARLFFFSGNFQPPPRGLELKRSVLPCPGAKRQKGGPGVRVFGSNRRTVSLCPRLWPCSRYTNPHLLAPAL